MIVELGHFALVLALAVAVLQSVLPMIGAWKRWGGWMAVAEPAAITQLMLVALSAGALYYVSRTASEVYLYQQGLSSVYAAESGANVALGRLKTGAMGNQRFTLSVNGRRVKVTDTPTSSREGVILSTASDADGGYKRTVRITYTSEEHEGQRILTVTNVSS